MGSQYAKPPIEPHQFARNGQYPDAYLQNEMADLGNKLALFRGKEVFAKFSHELTSEAISAAERVRWRFAFRASPYANAIGVVAWMGPAVPDGPHLGVYSRLRIQDATPTTLGDAEFHYGYVPATTSATPANMSAMWVLLKDSNGDVVAPVAGTDYYGTVSDFQGRILGISVYEMSINATPPFREGHGAGSPVLDLDREELVLGARKLWKYGAGHLMNWCVDVAGSPITRTSVTPINIVDNTSTGVSAATPGYTLDLRYRSTVRRTTVPCIFKVYASCPGLGSAMIKDSTSGAVVTIANISAAGWYSARVNLPATLAKYDLHAAGDGVNAISISAVSLYQDETGT